MKHIDPHVHCRDWSQSYKATIKSVTELARSQGIVAIFDMPNTEPPILTKALVEKRLQTAIDENCIDGYYLYMGITSKPEQIREAVETFNSNKNCSLLWTSCSSSARTFMGICASIMELVSPIATLRMISRLPLSTHVSRKMPTSMLLLLGKPGIRVTGFRSR